MDCARPFAVLRWPGAVPIFRKCEACDGKGSKMLNPGTETITNRDGSVAYTILTGHIILCSRCRSGYLTRYGMRGKSFTPMVSRSKSVWERLYARR
jgi:hypothetical protein